jgi:hypothetical protein
MVCIMYNELDYQQQESVCCDYHNKNPHYELSRIIRAFYKTNPLVNVSAIDGKIDVWGIYRIENEIERPKSKYSLKRYL